MNVHSTVETHKWSLLKIIDATLKVFGVKLSHSLFGEKLDKKADIPTMYKLLVEAATVSKQTAVRIRKAKEECADAREESESDSSFSDMRRQAVLQAAKKINSMAFDTEFPHHEVSTGRTYQKTVGI